MITLSSSFFVGQLVIDFVKHLPYDYQTQDTLETYLDAVAIRNTVFVKGQGARSIEMMNEAYCIHFVLYDDKGKAAVTVRLLPNKDLTQLTFQRMAVLDAY